MAYDIKGKIKRIGDTQQVSERFRKAKLVLEISDDRYPQILEFEATNDRTDALRDFRVGDEVRITFNLRGREWTDPKGEVKVFNTLDVWKVENVNSRGSDRRGGGHDSAPAGGARPPDDDIPF